MRPPGSEDGPFPQQGDAITTATRGESAAPAAVIAVAFSEADVVINVVVPAGDSATALSLPPVR